MNADVIIPVYRPGEKFTRLLKMLGRQTCPPQKIIIMNTEQSFWNTEYEKVPNLEVHHVTREEFDHGGTRNLGTTYSDAEVFIFMTDDAVPQDEHLVEQLLKGFELHGPAGEVPAVVYARQLADKDCRLVERYTRSFNYPKETSVKTLADMDRLGIKTYFASNVCCGYRRDIYEKLGGFITKTIFNEDMIYAAKAICAGYAVVYQAEARVVHSHNYTAWQQFHRNFDLAVSQADHPEVFEGIKSESEGMRLVKKTAVYLIHQKKLQYLPELVVKSGCKYLGYLMGKRYRKLPKNVVLWCSMNQSYWKECRE